MLYYEKRHHACSSKHLLLCSREGSKAFTSTWEWENNDRILIIGRPVTLKECMWQLCMWEEINSKEEFNAVPECFVPWQQCCAPVSWNGDCSAWKHRSQASSHTSFEERVNGDPVMVKALFHTDSSLEEASLTGVLTSVCVIINTHTHTHIHSDTLLSQSFMASATARNIIEWLEGWLSNLFFMAPTYFLKVNPIRLSFSPSPSFHPLISFFIFPACKSKPSKKYITQTDIWRRCRLIKLSHDSAFLVVWKEGLL